MNGELLRLIDSIHRTKDISLDILFEALEEALASALRKRLGTLETIGVTIDRETGQITNNETGEAIDPSILGRIAAQTAKQVLTQKVREAERDVIFDDYEERVNDIVNGTIQRIERGNVIVNLRKTEGFLPRREQVRTENYRVGDRIRCYVCDVRKAGSHVRIILSRSHPELIRKLFALEVPEISERIIEIKGLAREPGYRTKIAVYSVDSKVDAVGACVGVRGTRIKNIVAELSGEKIDIVRWSDQPDIFIANALNPAEIQAISLNPVARLARVIVAEDQLSRAIGALGQNVRIASKLTGWDIDVMSQEELDGELDRMTQVLGDLTGVGDKTLAKLFTAGFSLKKLASSSIDAVTTVEGVGEAIAERIVNQASEFVAKEKARIRAEREAAAAAEAAAVKAAEAAMTASPPDSEAAESGAEEAPETQEQTESEAETEPDTAETSEGAEPEATEGEAEAPPEEGTEPEAAERAADEEEHPAEEAAPEEPQTAEPDAAPEETDTTDEDSAEPDDTPAPLAEEPEDDDGSPEPDTEDNDHP
jgi:N utilization substance protein A